MSEKTQKNEKQKVFVLLDTHALIHRAFHALPPLMSPAGEPVGAVYGVANIVLKILKDFSPDYIAAAFDRPEPTFRHEAYKEYKAQRVEAPDDLIRQFDSVRELFQAFGIRIYDKAGYEADDIIGTLVAKARAADKNLTIIIASGDMDTTQLVDGTRTSVFTMRKGITDTVLYDEKAVRERFGFAPAYMPDFKGLKGDPSDNIKGVPGVGEKTATTLIQKYGTLEKIYESLSKKKLDTAVFKGKLPDILRAHKEEAYSSRDLARIRTDVPVSFQAADTAWKGIQSSASARAFLERLGFASLVSRLYAAGESRLPAANKNSAQMSLMAAEKTPRKARAFSAEFFSRALSAQSVSWIAVEDAAVCAGVAGNDAWNINEDDIQKNAKQFQLLFQSNAPHIAFCGKEILRLFWKAGVDSPRMDFDVGIAAWVLRPEMRNPDLFDLLDEKLSFRAKSAEEAGAHMPKLRKILEKELKASKLEKVFFDIEMPLVPVLAHMENMGIRIDIKILSDFSKSLQHRMDQREARIYELAGAKFNINSPKQLGEILFEKLGIASDAVRKTGGGARSTRASELTKLKGAHPLVDEILAWREEMKLKSTYVDVLPGLIDPATKRIHTTFNQTGTVTGRLSSQNPNMQNIPIRTPLGLEIRRAFVAAPGYTLVSFDYSQIELRLAAHLSGDKNMIQAFRDGNADIHTLTAAAVNHAQPADVTPTMRRAAKAINFGILYGMGAQSLAESLGIGRREADSFIRAYFEQFPGIKTLMEKLKRDALERGFVETLFGRRRYFPNMANLGWQARREAERMAINAPIQGSDSDIIKVAMVRVYRQLSEDIQQGDVKLLLQVHDELLFEVKQPLVKSVSERVRNIMEHACELAVPLRVDVRTGANWKDMV